MSAPRSTTPWHGNTSELGGLPARDGEDAHVVGAEAYSRYRHLETGSNRPRGRSDARDPVLASAAPHCSRKRPPATRSPCRRSFRLGVHCHPTTSPAWRSTRPRFPLQPRPPQRFPPVRRHDELMTVALGESEALLGNLPEADEPPRLPRTLDDDELDGVRALPKGAGWDDCGEPHLAPLREGAAVATTREFTTKPMRSTRACSSIDPEKTGSNSRPQHRHSSAARPDPARSPPRVVIGAAPRRVSYRATLGPRPRQRYPRPHRARRRDRPSPGWSRYAIERVGEGERLGTDEGQKCMRRARRAVQERSAIDLPPGSGADHLSDCRDDVDRAGGESSTRPFR